MWREAFNGDGVCVTPDIREQAWADNAGAQSRYQRNLANRHPTPPPEPVEEPVDDQDVDAEEPPVGGGGGGGDDGWGDPCAPDAWDDAFGQKGYNDRLCEPVMQAPEEPDY